MSSMEHDGPAMLGLAHSVLAAIPAAYIQFFLNDGSVDKQLFDQQVIRDSIKVRFISVFERVPLAMQYKSTLQSREMHMNDNSEFELSSTSVELIAIVIVILAAFRSLLAKLFRLPAVCLRRLFRFISGIFHWILSTWFYLGWKLPMGCFYWLWRRLCRIGNWVKIKLTGKSNNLFKGGKKKDVGDYKTFDKVDEQRMKIEKDKSFEIKLKEETDGINLPSTSIVLAKEIVVDPIDDDVLRNELDEYENSLKPTDEEVKREQQHRQRIKQLQKEQEEAEKKMNELMRAQENSSEDESEAKRRESEEEFQRKLSEQERVFREKMEKIKEDRERMEQELKENLQRIRREAHERTIAFFNCVLLKMRFEQKEQEVSDFLNTIRKPIVIVTTSYYNLQVELREFQREGNTNRNYQNEARIFARKIVNAQTVLEEAFGKLEDVSEQNENRIFVRMIMKSISETGQKLQLLGEKLMETVQSPTSYRLCSELDSAVSNLSPHSIPSTGYLRQNEPIEAQRPERYLNIPNVPYPNWFTNFRQ